MEDKSEKIQRKSRVQNIGRKERSNKKHERNNKGKKEFSKEETEDTSNVNETE